MAELVQPNDPGSASVAFLTWGAALVFLMCAGLGLFYSGLSRYNNALSLMMLCMLSASVVTVQFFLFGFSLALSETGSPFIGDFKMGALTTLGSHAFPHTAPAVPSVTFMLYQMQFATITAALIFGSVPERTRFVPAMLFVFIWTTVVYDVVAYWTWADHGWLKNLSCLKETISDRKPCLEGAYDFAGGGPVHISSGFAGLAYCLMIGKRKRIHEEHHNLINVFLGVGLLWFGWFAFNGGSAGSATARASMAALVTTISAATAGLSWTFFDYIFTRKLSALGYCSGVVAGLVCITPASGFVAPWVGLVFGLFAGVGGNLWIRVKKKLNFDDSFDAWSIHGIGGFVGNLLTAMFAEKWVAKLDGTEIHGGWIDGNWILMAYQLTASVVIAVYSFIVSLVILYIINKIPGLHLRQSEKDEYLGGDFIEMGEVAYMLEITDPEVDPSPDSVDVGVLRDGRLVSISDPIAGSGAGSARPSLATSNGKRGTPRIMVPAINVAKSVHIKRDSNVSNS